MSYAQGGPPLLTDDPGTPGNGHWEINIAATVDAAPGRSAPAGYTFETPIIDLNYGWGPRIQLKLEWPWLERAGAEVAASGPGNPLAGVKWRPIGMGEGDGLSVSTYPQIALRSTDRAVAQGLAEPAGALLLPIEVREGIGRTVLDGEAGYRFGARDERAVVYGAIVGETVSARVELLAEVHDELAISPSDSANGGTHNLTAVSFVQRHTVIANVGARVGLSAHETLLLSVGHGVAISGGEPEGVQGYAGVQLVF